MSRKRQLPKDDSTALGGNTCFIYRCAKEFAAWADECHSGDSLIELRSVKQASLCAEDIRLGRHARTFPDRVH